MRRYLCRFALTLVVALVGFTLAGPAASARPLTLGQAAPSSAWAPGYVAAWTTGVPSDGTITRFQLHDSAMAYTSGSVKFQVWRLSSGSTYSLVYQSDAVQLKASGRLTTLRPKGGVSVQAGDRFAVYCFTAYCPLVWQGPSDSAMLLGLDTTLDQGDTATLTAGTATWHPNVQVTFVAAR